ncbi:MAG TPA: DOPA 4,5-dioxygenase family protein [Allosphingosinicella sp.]
MTRSIGEIASYHAHVYFVPGEASEASARLLREEVGDRFAVQLGTWWDRPVGPHALAMFQIAFAPDLFAGLVPWLMLNHKGLSILIHPNTANQRRDHVVDPIWIGTALPVDETVLADEDGEAELRGAVNTTPTVTP